MSLAFTVFSIPSIIGGVLAVVVTWYSWRRRSVPSARPFIVLCLATVVWCFGYALERSAVELEGQVFWAKVQYLGIVAAPVAFLVFVWSFTQRERLVQPRVVAALSVIPVLTVAMVWTTEWHGLVWRDIGLMYDGGFPSLRLTRGPWFWFVHVP
ncbi:MAG: hypothetical protein NZ518_06225, partial [Dehalococcoidia bacterium]|nr:hypothetical protein [Dehalococcoidia bacterium]